LDEVDLFFGQFKLHGIPLKLSCFDPACCWLVPHVHFTDLMSAILYSLY
jgi:hypothetical protein